ncbi:hypothetical protein CWE09_08310 [Aliidiomarina minuta]|uniref:MSHA biogenesis protein MshI n=1 Tax=Aliidiomarina minuta TaxID=880057 RepID=A0A432W9B5_9GAMM|nr:PilN domain-containing protein [Aliidiomarina minuta]RUO26689.1 hypothetical protein CWE09_08310 [Aliidiomarina minuta]
MKHSINLYTDALRPVRELVTLARVAALVALLLLIMLILRGSYAWQEQRLSSEQRQLEAQLTEQRVELTQLARQQSAQRVQPELQQRVDNLQQQLDLQQALARELESRGGFSQANYARILRDLSAIHQPDLWLTHIEKDQGRLVLRGQTLSSANLPRWMSRFDQVESLRGHQFAVVALERDDSDVIQFELRSQRQTSSVRLPGERP